MYTKKKEHFWSISEAYEELKNKFCPKCKHFKKNEHCLNFAMCFVNFFLREEEPHYFSPKLSDD